MDIENRKEEVFKLIDYFFQQTDSPSANETYQSILKTVFKDRDSWKQINYVQCVLLHNDSQIQHYLNKLDALKPNNGDFYSAYISLRAIADLLDVLKYN